MSPDVIRSGLLFEDSYLYLVFASAVLVSSVGLAAVRRIRPWTTMRPARRHVVGSLIFGLGWGVADACPGPIAAQIGQGIAWAIPTLAGTVLGVYLFLRRNEDTEPAKDSAPLGALQSAHSH